MSMKETFSAGSAARIDLCLHIVRKDFGTLTANKVARRLVVSPHREGGQAQFIDKPVGDPSNPWLPHLLEWVQARLQNPITIDQLAIQARMSKRTLSRRFSEATGTSPLDWVTGLRIRLAKDLLGTTELSVEEVAGKCGFNSAPVNLVRRSSCYKTITPSVCYFIEVRAALLKSQSERHLR
jgi:AraC family transcriptional regulator, transcriptional activator FtrA